MSVVGVADVTVFLLTEYYYHNVNDNDNNVYL